MVQEGDGKSIHLDNLDDVKTAGFNHILKDLEEWLIQLQINNRINELKFTKKRNTTTPLFKLIESNGLKN